MICESCGNTYDDNLTVCPVCGVSAAQSLANPDLQTVSQTVPPFVRRLGAEPEVKLEPAPAHGADNQPFLNKSVPKSQPSDVTHKERNMSIDADYSNSQKNTSPSKKGNAAAVTGLILGGLCFIFNLAVFIVSQTGTGKELFDIAVFEFYLLIPYWIITFLGMILCINRPDSRKKAIACLIICVINTIIYAIIFKVFLMPYYVNQLSEIFSPPMPYNLDK